MVTPTNRDSAAAECTWKAAL
ncbi:unnamed protein product [Ectocarpus sp. CCAP 1310/34]|nr:unnamed protein product [Ectocarpus sp. CCAP 1310/34]